MVPGGASVHRGGRPGAQIKPWLGDRPAPARPSNTAVASALCSAQETAPLCSLRSGRRRAPPSWTLRRVPRDCRRARVKGLGATAEVAGTEYLQPAARKHAIERGIAPPTSRATQTFPARGATEVTNRRRSALQVLPRSGPRTRCARIDARAEQNLACDAEWLSRGVSRVHEAKRSETVAASKEGRSADPRARRVGLAENRAQPPTSAPART